MASIFFIEERAAWFVKWKSPTGWRRANVGKHPTPFPKGKPPKRPPDSALKRAAPFIEREREAKAAPGEASKDTGLEGYMAAHHERMRATRTAEVADNFERYARSFVAYCKTRGVTTVQQVARTTCRDFMEHRLTKVAAITVKTERNYLRAVFTRAEEDEIIPANPWRHAKPPGKSEPGEPVFWSGGEVSRIAAAARVPWHADIILLMANTGLRVSAALAAEFSWFDMDRGVVKVPRKDDKGGKGYEIPLTSVAREVVFRRGLSSANRVLIFHNPRGKPYTASGFRQSFKSAVKDAGVKMGTPHDLRHTFARSLCDAGVPINVVQAALGHSSLAMTQRYTSAAAETAKTHMEGFSVGGKPEPKPE